MPYRIHCLNTGHLPTEPGAATGATPTSQRSPWVPALAFLLTSPRRCLLFDTGMPPTPVALEHRPGSEQPQGWDLMSRLAALGLAPEQIDAVIYSHLHWDHVAFGDQLPRVPKLLQESEAAFARAPSKHLALSYKRAPLVLDDPAITLLRGETRWDPEILLIPTPGHSPGHQSLLVQTAQGPVVLAGDAAWPGPAGPGLPRKVFNASQARASLRRLLALGCPLWAAHDPSLAACQGPN